MILFSVRLSEENVYKKIENKIDRLLELQQFDQCLKYNSESTQTNDFNNPFLLFPLYETFTPPPMDFFSVFKCKLFTKCSNLGRGSQGDGDPLEHKITICFPLLSFSNMFFLLVILFHSNFKLVN